MSTPVGVYPFSTQDGKAIPLDIVNPAGLIFKSFVAGSGASFTIPAGKTVGVFFCNADAIISFGADMVSMAENTVHSKALLVPANTTLTTAFEAGTAYVRGISGSGIMYLQLIEKWAGLGLPTQYVRM